MPEFRLKPYWSAEGASLYLGDCLSILHRFRSVDLIFADPPFNIGYKYDVYQDKKSYKDYLEWTSKWLTACYNALKPTGSFWIAICPKYQAEMKVLMDEVGFHWRDTVVWHYTFGPRQERKLTPSWVALHYATKDPQQWTWNKDSIRVPSARLLKYNDRRAVPKGKLPDNVWALTKSTEDELFDPSTNCWLSSRVCGTFKERTEHPCQMPVALLSRIVQVSSNPGDVVLDPFLGSGTTADAALRNHRRVVGIELSQAYLDDCCIPRLQAVLKDRVGSV